MSTKRSPSEIPLNFGMRTVREAIQELSMDQSGESDKDNWNENCNVSNDISDSVVEGHSATKERCQDDLKAKEDKDAHARADNSNDESGATKATGN